MAGKKSIRFYNDREVRAVWDEAHSKWWFSAIDIVRAINDEEDYVKAGNYWRWLKRKLAGEGIQLVSVTHDFKFEAPDGKLRASDALDTECVQTLAKHYPANRANAFLDWFTYSDNTIDGQSKKKAYDLFESGLLDSLEPGTVKCLQQIHAYIFGGLYDFAGQIRTKNISKGGFTFANALHFPTILPTIEKMPDTSFDEIADKYVEMNVAHPFMEGNGRSTRIWLDLMLRRSLKKCVDWSRIDKNAYLEAMRCSLVDPAPIKALLSGALTDKINDRETFMKGIDYSYYYEQPEYTFKVSDPFTTPPPEFSTPLQEAVYGAFARLDIPFERVDTDPGLTMEDCQHIDAKIGVRIVKTVFLCNRQQTEFYLYVTTDDKPFVTREFCGALGIPRVSFASAEKLRELTGVEVGATTILSAILPECAQVHLVIDKAVAESEWFACTDGTATCFVKIRTADLLGKYLQSNKYTLI